MENKLEKDKYIIFLDIDGTLISDSTMHIKNYINSSFSAFINNPIKP